MNLDNIDARAAGVAVTEFLNWWEGVLSKDEKFQLFLQLFRFPVPTVAFSGKIYTALEKVFDGRNPVQQYDFRVPEAAEDWEEYREQIKLPEFFRRKVFDAMTEGCINSLVVIDLPTEQSDQMPTPYPYLLGIESVYDYQWNGEAFDWICWFVDEDTLAFFDPFHFRVLRTKQKGGIEIESVIAEVPHDLGYTPVRFMWSDAISSKCQDLKESPLSKYLGEMDWLLAYKISKRVNELTAQYPIYWGYAEKCDYIEEDPDKGVFVQCNKGVLVDGMGKYLIEPRTRGIRRCPACANRRLLGAGSMVRKPFPADPDQKDIGDPVGVVPAEAVSLEYNQQEVRRLEAEIFTGVTGAEKEAINDKAVNEKQVGAIVDSKTQCLKNLKTNFEAIQKWTEETICKLRYGNLFTGATINLGTEFHLHSADDLLNQYQEKRVEGADAATLDRLWDDYLSARYRYDPVVLERQRILSNLDPFRHRTPAEVKSMGIASPEMLYLKFNFSTLVMRFEREQTSIIEFGSALPFRTKIARISQILSDYAKENTTTENTEAGEAGRQRDGSSDGRTDGTEDEDDDEENSED